MYYIMYQYTYIRYIRIYTKYIIYIILWSKHEDILSLRVTYQNILKCITNINY